MAQRGKHSWTLAAVALCAAAAALVTDGGPGLAAVPGHVGIEGLLSSTGGGPVADGKYAVTFRLYDKEVAGQVLWQEGAQQVEVAGGLFSTRLGTQTPIDAAVLASVTSAWLGLQVGAEPELPRKPLSSVFLALRAAVAENLACSGCVTEGMLDPKLVGDLARKSELAKVASSGKYTDLLGSPDLSGLAQKAELADVATTGSYADLANAPKLAKIATSGAYGDLAGAPTLPELGKACGTGLVIQGLKADGSYDCVVAMDAAALPKDGLDEISNGLLYNQFDEKATSTKTPLDIPDNNPVGISDLIDLPDFGTAQALTVSVELTNSDTANVQVLLVDPGNTKFTLWDKSAKGTALKTSWPAPTKTVSGDLTSWVGKNPKGKWYVQVIDTAFLNNAADGKLVGWSLQVKVLASSKVGVGGGLVLKNAADPPYACDATVTGSVYFDTKSNAIRYCALGVWRSLADTCGNGILEVTEECDDGNNAGDDGCSATCVAAVGYVKGKPGASCVDILAKGKSAGLALKDGLGWVDPNGGATTDAYQVWCRMTGDYAGATLAIKRPGSVGGAETQAGDVNLPCTPSTQGYCKLSDARINALRSASANLDAYIVLSYKDAGTTPFCKSFARKACQWISDGAAGSGCENSIVRNSGAYCSRNQTTASYRGIDGHTCGNLVYPGVTSPNNPFMIFEHSGGTHYCGGWDTTWDRIEMLVQ
jgi:cysteine-rich repeat protein